MKRLSLVIGAAALLAAPNVEAPQARRDLGGCKPTPLGSAPGNYRAGSPVRSSVGRGHVLVGVVRSSLDCSPIAHARLEFWQASPQGRYSVAPSWAYRSTVFTRRDGSYRYETPIPGRYRHSRPHIHVRVSAPGFRVVFAVHLLQPGEKRGRLDLVLRPAGS